MSHTDHDRPNTAIIDASDFPVLATSGHKAPPSPGATREQHKIAVVDLVGDTLVRICGPVKTAKDTGEVGKIAADKLIDKGKEIEDKAIHEEKDARDAEHKKVQEDKGKTHHDAAGARGGIRSATFNAFARSLDQLRP